MNPVIYYSTVIVMQFIVMPINYEPDAITSSQKLKCEPYGTDKTNSYPLIKMEERLPAFFSGEQNDEVQMEQSIIDKK